MDATRTTIQTMTQLRARHLEEREASKVLHATGTPASPEEAARLRERLDEIPAEPVGQIVAHPHAVSEDGRSATCVRCGQRWAAHATVGQRDSACPAT